MNTSDTNAGGWPATTMRTYLNESILGTFPADLRKVIIDTYVVSGHGSQSGATNFTSIDKLYLLSTKEIWGSTNYDTVEETRQLEYYGQNAITKSSNNSFAIKKKADSAAWWWLRAADSSITTIFRFVSTDGSSDNSYATASSSGGVSPAFRIG